MNRDEELAQVRDRDRPFDLVVIGGGATGLGVAVDAASRGYDVALVMEALKERGRMRRTPPVYDLGFIVPSYE